MVNYFELLVSNPVYFKQFSCKDVLFLNYDCPAQLKKFAKWSEHNHIFYVLSGKKILHTTEGSVTLTGGSFVFIKKGACIVEQFFDEVFCVVVFIMPDSFLHSFLKDYAPDEKARPVETPPVFPLHDDEMIRGFYQSILPYFGTKAQVSEDIIELKFRELLLCLLRNPANEQLHHYLLSVRENPKTAIREIMETNFAYNLSIEAYARLTNRSISSFKRDFQTIYKTTPGRWLIEKKLALAKKLLLQTSDSITSVAFESGFENAAHFCRLFKQKTGITPMAFRKQTTEKRLVAS
jgi:AraC-like DNA-binding protein